MIVKKVFFMCMTYIVMFGAMLVLAIIWSILSAMFSEEAATVILVVAAIAFVIFIIVTLVQASAEAKKRQAEEAERAKQAAIEQAERDARLAAKLKAQEKQRAIDAEKKKRADEEQARQRELAEQKRKEQLEAEKAAREAQRKRQASELRRKARENARLQSEAYDYFTSDPESNLAIKNFVTQNEKSIESLILDTRMEELKAQIKATKEASKNASKSALSRESSITRVGSINEDSIRRRIADLDASIEKQAAIVAKLSRDYRAAVREEEKMIATYRSYHSISENATAYRKKTEAELESPKARLKAMREELKSKKKELTATQSNSLKEQRAEELALQKELQKNDIELSRLETEYERLKSDYDDYDALVVMLTKVLSSGTTYSAANAKAAIEQAIISAALNQWKIDFDECYKPFCARLDYSKRDECIGRYASYFHGKNVAVKAKFSFFLLINGIVPTHSTSLKTLRKDFEGFEAALEAADKNVVLEEFKKSLLSSGEHISIDDVDRMDGAQFEQYVAELFEKMGYKTEVTKHSNDQGIDVLAKNEIVTIGIQAKCYSGAVGNAAVQEAIAGKTLYKADKVMVVTNNKFTPAAKELAKAANVELWDRRKLMEKIAQYY